jgi:ABC-type multidrug transport system permease subunit
MLFFLFQASWGQWITAFAPSFTVISNVLPFFFVMFSLFNGVVRPYSELPVFWRYWMYYVVSFTFILKSGLTLVRLVRVDTDFNFVEPQHLVDRWSVGCNACRTAN